MLTGFLAGQADNNNGNGGNGMFGDQGWWVIILFALIFGWGGNGNGWGGNGNNGGGGVVPTLSGIATRSDIMDGFALNDLQRGVSGIQQGICDSTYAITNGMNSGFSGVNLALCNGFNGVQQGFNQLGYQMQQCLKKIFTKAKAHFNFSYCEAVGTCA